MEHPYSIMDCTEQTSQGEALQAQLRMAGIDLKLEIVPGPVQLERAQKKTFDLMYERQRVPVPDVLHLVSVSYTHLTLPTNRCV